MLYDLSDQRDEVITFGELGSYSHSVHVVILMFNPDPV